MPDGVVETNLDVHQRLLAIAKQAKQQVASNPVANDSILPVDVARPDPPYGYNTR